MISDFFIWCAGSDKNILSKCELSDRIKHIGLGTLVLIPAVLGTISMSYALSTIHLLNPYPLAYISGGFVWGLIVFAFDRFIVSTHKKSPKDGDEFKNFSFYARFVFAIFVGIAISHPFVLLWFDSSIQERMTDDKYDKLTGIITDKQEYKKMLTVSFSSIDSLETEKKRLQLEKECNEVLLTYEQSGQKVSLPCGASSGILGNSIRAAKIEDIIKERKTDIKKIEDKIQKENDRIEKQYGKYSETADEKTEDVTSNWSTDYIKREHTLEELKKDEKSQGHNVIAITQFFIILVILLVDLLPLIFKTFAPFSLYDKIRSDDKEILNTLEKKQRKTILQQAYDKINIDYYATKINPPPFIPPNVNWWVIFIVGVFVIPLMWIILAFNLKNTGFGITNFGTYIILPIMTSTISTMLWNMATNIVKRFKTK